MQDHTKIFLTFKLLTMFTLFLYPQIKRLANKSERTYSLILSIFLDFSLLMCILNPQM